MSGGQQEAGKPVLKSTSRENTSNTSSYSGSEPCSEFSLPSTSAGPTISSGAGRKSEQGRAGDNREVSGRSQNSQQLKCYGRRNRVKQAVSVHNGRARNDCGEVEGAGLVGCLAVDLTGQLETGIDPISEVTLYLRNGSSGVSPGKVSSRLQGSVLSRGIIMDPGAFEVSSSKDAKEAFGAIDGERVDGQDSQSKILAEVARVLGKTGFAHVEDQEDSEKNGIVGAVLPRADCGSDETGDLASQVSQAKGRAEGGWATETRETCIGDAAVVVKSPPRIRISGNDSAGSSSGCLTGDLALSDTDDVEGESTKVSPDREIFTGGVSNDDAIDGTSPSTPSNIVACSSNGDQDRYRNQGPGRSSSRSHRSRVNFSNEGTDQSGVEFCKASGEQESSVLKGMPLRWRLALERRQHEESVLAKADDVWAKQEILDSTKKIPPKGKEPARCKTHWDFVLEEMAWLAKDFERERKWKLSQAKKVAVRVSRSKLDVEAKGIRRLKEEEQRTRRVASNIAKDVKKFWMKVEKLVMYKHQLELEERRKKALDKHLDFLLGQTERYSTMLAENLGEVSATPVFKALPTVPVVPDTTAGGKESSALAKEISEEDVKIFEGGDFTVRAGIRVETGAATPMYVSEKLDATRSGIHETERMSLSLTGAEDHVENLAVDVADEDFNFDNEVEEEDDETTLEADEALITEEERREELSVLQRESELPLEELLKLYGRNGDESDSDGAGDSANEEGDGDHEGYASEEDEKGKGIADAGADIHAISVKDDVSSGRLSPTQARDDDSLEYSSGGGEEFQRLVVRKAELTSGQSAVLDCTGASFSQLGIMCSTSRDLVDDDKGAAAGELAQSSGSRMVSLTPGSERNPNKDLATEALLQESQDTTDDREYIPAALTDGNEEDDESTLEEEERLAKMEAGDPTDELDRLKQESEMSVEELLAQYQSMAAGWDPDEDMEASDEENFVDRQDRTSEAGTSGSGEEDDEGGYDDMVGDLAEAKERMGEPSTSGREQWSLISSGYGRKLKKKSTEQCDTPEEGKSNVGVADRPFENHGRSASGEEKMLSKMSQNQLENGGSWVGSASQGGTVASGLQAEKVIDAATKEAMQRTIRGPNIRDKGMSKLVEREQEPNPFINPDDEDNSVDEGVMKPLTTLGHNADVGDTSNPMQAGGGAPSPGTKKGLGDIKLSIKVDDSVQEADGKSSPAKVPGIGDGPPVAVEGKTSEDKLADAAAAAQSAQPTGYTFSTTKVRTKLPFLLKHSLREYQHIGLDWLVTMYEKRLNGILADEMGLGKTIMTISLLAHLACDRGIWGPHLIVVPTSVMLNWETEFMKWCPAFKILTYFGSAKERKLKRQGWSKPNSFHVCITTYRLVIQDAKAFKRKKWKYLILDEAHLIKNWKSQRWQTLLNFNSKRRILLTGTPLQNDLMELWSLMHFLMPHVFQSHQEFRDWFSNPITGMVEGQEQVNKEVVDRLHNVLRPFLLRRLKKDVEKQLPQKYEHVINCRLSKRQRNLYEDFMASSDTQATLSSGNFLGLINVLMQLRKVCNHPDLFEGRPIVSSYDMAGFNLHFSSLVSCALCNGPFSKVNLEELNLLMSQIEMTTWEGDEITDLCTRGALIEELSSTGDDCWQSKQRSSQDAGEDRGIIEEIQAVLRADRLRQKKEKVSALVWLNLLRCAKKALYGSDLRKCVSMEDPVHDVHKIRSDPRRFLEFSSVVADIVRLPLARLETSMGMVESFVFSIPAARAPTPVAWCSHPPSPNVLLPVSLDAVMYKEISSSLEPLRPVFVRRQLFFPDRRLLQFDCGKLQQLAILLRRLKSEGHRALIFTQMTRMLDVLESFINLYGYTYMRLDGSTKPEQRQILMQRFNTNPKIFLFILSTRSGGVGINLVGADTVIFYDSDWNPAMDQQAQDRCHRIGQTREVHIYRLVSESTIEENILKKANQKRLLDDLVIQSGGYNTEFFKKLDPMELFSGLNGVKIAGGGKGPVVVHSVESESATAVKTSEVSSADVEAALKNAEDEADYMAMKKVEQEEAAENQEFTEEVFVGNLEDEELAEELEEGKSMVVKNQADGVGGASKEGLESSGRAVTSEEVPQIGSALTSADAEEEMDMLADVKQMAAAAAAAGRGSISFEDQLQPVERYAMRFLELWDPRVDKASEAAQVLFEEKEWELEKLEKLKEELEAEIDEDNEPLFYESWDTAFANEAYRQQVEVLAQQQENQRQLEWEAMEEEMRDADRAVAEAASTVVGAENFKVKSKSMKKLKKAKFKSLKKGSLASDDLVILRRNIDKDENYSDPQFEMSSLPSRSPSQRKRKAPKLLEEEILTEMHQKKMKKDHLKDRISVNKSIFSKKLSEFEPSGGGSDEEGLDSDAMDRRSKSPTSLSSAKKKPGGKISIMALPLKKGPLIMLEKERRKDGAKTQEHVPSADLWTSAEDAVLCAVVHEYGGNWLLASDALAGIPDGSVYRGRHRHPMHCRERFRQLLAQNAAAAASGDPTSEKNALSAATNAHVKVTEEHTKRLLEVVLQLPDSEPLLQRHFAAVLTAVRNQHARKQREIDELGVAVNMQIISPKGTSLSCLLKLEPPLLSSPSGNTTSIRRSTGDLVSLLDEALAGVGEDLEMEPEENRTVADSPPQEQSADAESKLLDEKFSILDYLEADTGLMPPAGLEPLTSEHRTPFLPVHNFLGFMSANDPAVCPDHALRSFAENAAEQRFRAATNGGWGAGVYDWAAAAAYGLGSAGMPYKVKPKKRPPPADSSKQPKQKQPRIPKGSKKTTVDASLMVVLKPSVSSNGAIQLDSVARQDSNSGTASRHSSGPTNGGDEEHAAQEEQEHRQNSGEKNSSHNMGPVTAGSLIRKERKEISISTAIKSSLGKSKVKTAKVKFGESPFGTKEKKIMGGSSATQSVEIRNIEAVTVESARQVSPLVDAGSLSPDVGPAFEDLGVGGSDDEIVITGVSLPATGRAVSSLHFPSSIRKVHPRTPGDRRPSDHIDVDLLQPEKLVRMDPKLSSRTKDSELVTPGAKPKSWPEGLKKD